MSNQASNWQGMNWIRQEKRLAIYLRDSFTCQCCGSDLHNAATGGITLDHLRPRSFGGSNDASNLVTVCALCNSSRGAKRWTTFYPAPAIATVRRLRCRTLNVPLAKEILAGRASAIEATR